MFNAVMFIHSVKILHCDIKPDNWMLEYHSHNGITIRLIDFGKAKDLLFCIEKDGVQSKQHHPIAFLGSCAAKGYRCVEMDNNLPWTFQVSEFL